MRITKGIYDILRIFVPVFYWSLRHEDVCVNGGIALHILNLPALYGYELTYLRPEKQHWRIIVVPGTHRIEGWMDMERKQ